MPVTMPPDPAGVAAALIHISGSLIVGYLLAWGLYGVLAVQVYVYFLSFPHDRTMSKWLVGIVFLLETAQVIVIARDIFASFIYGFGNPDAITATNLTGFSGPIIAGVVGFLVQLFYAYRIRVLSDSNTIPILICMLALIQCVGAFISGIRGFLGGDVRKLDTMTDRVGHGLFNAATAACDIVIAIAMSYYLPKMNSGIRERTQVLIRKIISLVVGTGTLTATIAILDQILFEAFPGKGYFLTPAFVIGKLYSNSMMVIFNSRTNFGPSNKNSSVALRTTHHDVQLTSSGIPRFSGPRDISYTDGTYYPSDPSTEIELRYPKIDISNHGHR